jgi:hemerythrin-like domain-containing protein
MANTALPWADTPFALIPMPGEGKDLTKEHESIFIAQEMTFAHNGIIRCLNSIYQHCVHVKEPEDIKDLLQYTQFWAEWIHEHHDAEETFLFPDIERVSGVKGLMESNIAQHDAFMPGLEELGTYASETTPENYDSLKLRRIIDHFGLTLTTHLSDEIKTLLDLNIFDGPALKKEYLKFDEELRKGDSVSASSLYLCPTVIENRTLTDANLISISFTQWFSEVRISTTRMRTGLLCLALSDTWCIIGLSEDIRELGDFRRQRRGEDAVRSCFSTKRVDSRKMLFEIRLHRVTLLRR